MEKKNNHYVPRCLLKRWVTYNGIYNGVNVLDLQAKKISFSSATGRSAFSFASLDNLYILSNNEKRLTNLEDWLGGLESSLSSFINEIILKKTDILNNLSDLNKLIMCLNSFEFRSPYFFEQGLKYLEKNQKIKESFKGKSSFQIILENVVNGTTELTNLMYPVEFIVWNSNIPILICDRPLIQNLVDGYSFMSLTPHLILSFKKTYNKSIISYRNLDDRLAISYNEMIKSKARKWIVSYSSQELGQIEIKNNHNDSVEFFEVKTLLKGSEY